MIVPDTTAQRSRLERELAYYRRELDETGARVIRLQEEQQRLFLELQRSRLITKLARELYRISDLDASASTLPRRVLEAVVEYVMCDGAALLRERQLGSGTFAILCQVGATQSEQPLQLRKAPPFLFTTSSAAPDPHASAIVAWMGIPHVLWTHDPSSGFALVLGNRSEGNARRPFGTGDKELVETSLTVFLDAWARSPRPDGAALPHGSSDLGEDPDGWDKGLEVTGVCQQIREGGRVLGVVIVERDRTGGSEYAAYVNVSWERGWRVLRTYRDRDDRTWRDFDRLLPYVRSELGFDASISVCSAGAADIERFPAIAARERANRRAVHAPMPMSFAGSLGMDDGAAADDRHVQSTGTAR